MSINKLADKYTAAKAVADAAVEEVEALKAKIEALGLPEVEGRTCVLTISPCERTTLVKDAVVAKLGKQWVKDNSKTTLYNRILISAKPTKGLVRSALEKLDA